MSDHALSQEAWSKGTERHLWTDIRLLSQAKKAPDRTYIEREEYGEYQVIHAILPVGMTLPGLGWPEALGLALYTAFAVWMGMKIKGKDRLGENKDGKPFGCKRCGIWFDDAEGYINHWKLIHDGRSGNGTGWKCPSCGSDKWRMDPRHKDRHQCDFCGKTDLTLYVDSASHAHKEKWKASGWRDAVSRQEFLVAINASISLGEFERLLRDKTDRRKLVNQGNLFGVYIPPPDWDLFQYKFSVDQYQHFGFKTPQSTAEELAILESPYFNKAYHRNMKVLHPDTSGEFTEVKRFWFRVTQAAHRALLYRKHTFLKNPHLVKGHSVYLTRKVEDLLDIQSLLVTEDDLIKDQPLLTEGK